ncbi:MAG: universal stress protein [Candidatus Binataceae bacterium]
MAPPDEKDRYGEKLRQAGKAREDQWAAERDRELLANLRRQSEQREAAKEPSGGETAKLFSRIVCPTDLQENSLCALEMAKRIAVQNDAIIYLVHVCPPVGVPLGGTFASTVGDEDLASEQLRTVASRKLSGTEHRLIVTTGEAAGKIIEVAQGLDADLIVMGTHGRRGISRPVLGSVAARVVREAPCPVLTSRTE